MQLRVRCSGTAHLTGEESQGTPIDGYLAPRLHALGLLREVEGVTVPTEKGYALLGGPLLCLS